MSFIIGNKCIGCIDAACLKVCPMDCIHGPILTTNMGIGAKDLSVEEKEGKQLYINPNDCILCGACVPECPVDAIYSSEKQAIELNDESSIEKNYGFFGLKFN